MLPKIKKAAFITLAGLFLLFGAGLDQFAIKSTVQSQQATEESVETEIAQAIETKRHTIRKTRKPSVEFLSYSKIAVSTTPSGFASQATPSLQTNRYLLYRSILI
jgi:CRISPR/Cas system CSM-associated protein Csm4 (group 5 of RAMP superfamily)